VAIHQTEQNGGAIADKENKMTFDTLTPSKTYEAPPVRTRSAQHVVVIGSGIAGLTMARTLADYFSQVTIIERDEPAFAQDFRSGVPQARHAHTLMPRGQAILEQLFPDLTNELIANGAVAVDLAQDVAFYHKGAWTKPQARSQNVSVSCSRPLLEATIYRRVTSLPQVSVLRGYRANGLTLDDFGRRVTGVQLQGGRGAGAQEMVQAADLVVDASGRQSQAPKWLATHGFVPPEEWRVNAFVGYATRLYRQPDGFAPGWKRLYIRPTPPDGTRGSVLLPQENGRWVVTLMGIAGDYPPTDEDGFLDFARSLPTSRLYDAIKDAEPLTPISGFRRTENRVRRYEKLPRYLEGFLVCGDAVFALNPVYAQGMTAAVMGSLVLDETLTHHHAGLMAGNLEGIAETFQSRLRQAVDGLWAMSTRKDWDWPITEVTDDTDL
jgi:2-polyprenyl-6-methoxyphenol hydroxylase-like FAD-dependent oxidoreductase